MPDKVYHLGMNREDVRAAQAAILPGDPGRVEDIAGTPAFEYSKEVACKREYRSWLGYLEGRPVLVTSTGIGGPSTSIAIEELAMLGIRHFIRVGTTGAIRDHISPGDVIITTGAVRQDGASTHYAPLEYPAVAHHEAVQSLVQAAQELEIKYHVGITCSSDTFYPGQERVDSFSGYVPRRFQGATQEWERLKVLNYEMEAATVLTMCSVLGLVGGCVTGVIVNRHQKEHISQDDLVLGENNAVQTAVRAMQILTREKN